MIDMPLSVFTKDESYPFFIHYGKHNEDVEMHTHTDFSELVFVLNGTATHVVEDEEFFIKKGDVFVISANTPHGYFNLNNFGICNIMFNSNYIMNIDNDIQHSAGFHALFVIEPLMTKSRSFQSRLKLRLPDFEAFQELIDKIINEYTNKHDGWKSAVRGYFTVMLVMLSRLYDFSESVDSMSAFTIAKAVAYMEANFTQNISIEALASIANLSARHFMRIFNEIYSTTPWRYMLSLRMQYACHLLRTTDMTVSEIAHQSGYDDSNYFSRQFKKTYSVSPKEFKKAIDSVEFPDKYREIRVKCP